eukprot:1884661-Pleurochrysis_carterae.AAC.1
MGGGGRAAAAWPGGMAGRVARAREGDRDDRYFGARACVLERVVREGRGLQQGPAALKLPVTEGVVYGLQGLQGDRVEVAASRGERTGEDAAKEERQCAAGDKQARGVLKEEGDVGVGDR